MYILVLLSPNFPLLVTQGAFALTPLAARLGIHVQQWARAATFFRLSWPLVSVSVSSARDKERLQDKHLITYLGKNLNLNVVLTWGRPVPRSPSGCSGTTSCR